MFFGIVSCFLASIPKLRLCEHLGAIRIVLAIRQDVRSQRPLKCRGQEVPGLKILHGVGGCTQFPNMENIWGITRGLALRLLSRRSHVCSLLIEEYSRISITIEL